MTSISHVIVALFTMKYGQFIRSSPLSKKHHSHHHYCLVSQK